MVLPIVEQWQEQEEVRIRKETSVRIKTTKRDMRARKKRAHENHKKTFKN